ncbi:hypothetical protein AUQ37_04155 [Candidatus Methanomethylophilus sp. 1R26]|uniref:ABC transporter substrate-binding protein n=1 Tax=Candidatus Methanomethylophilus sp. 1R26 TaxID=1769296 RepID=UPI00073786FF|nr:hypothetical protein [Candidatus Methanomethylophilus sp. 1R26]KUE73059.1 hypothetical protein AUQ37_04155 [Candidatus Methanomethylophilus sp. 1R26]
MYYGCYDAMALGIYDRITASTDRVINYKEDMFPGCNSFTMVGTNYTFDSELLMKTDVKAVLGAGNQDRYDRLKEIGIDVLMVKGSGQSASGIDVISSIITLGTLCSCEEAAQKYADYFDGVAAYIEENAKKLTKEYTYVMPYNPDSLVENTVDTKNPSGSMLGDVYAMSLLPMNDLIVSDNGSCPVIQTEDIMKKNPDFIVVSLVASLSALDDPDEVQKIFDEKFALYEKTDAYANGKMFGISYDSMGTTLGIGTLPLLCSMMWPDIFDEATAWNYFKESIDNFTELKYTDITKCGGLIVYGMS